MAFGRFERCSMATGDDANRAVLYRQLIKIEAAVDLPWNTTIRRAVGIHRPRPIAVPVLVWLTGRGDARRGAMELNAVAQNGLHARQHRRVVEQEGEAVIFFQKLMDKLTVGAGKGFVEGYA